jgi:hypothetical protein
MGRPGAYLRAPVDAQKLEWIAPWLPQAGRPIQTGFLITPGK